MEFSTTAFREAAEEVLSENADWVESQCGLADREEKTAKVTSTDIHTAVTHVDRELQSRIESFFRNRFPGVRTLGEEDVSLGEQDTSSLEAIVIDPIDGTLEFSKGNHGYTTLMACFVSGKLSAGGVAEYHPFRFSFGEWDRSKVWPAVSIPADTAVGQIRLAVHYRYKKIVSEVVRERLERLCQSLTEVPSDSRRSSHSNGGALLGVATGEWDAYIAPFTCFHDLAGPFAVAAGAGCVFRQFSNENESDDGSWHVIEPTFGESIPPTSSVRYRVVCARDQTTLDIVTEQLTGKIGHSQ